MAIPIIGKVFPTASQFRGYLDDLTFGAWRPRYIVMHHTGAPDLKTWNGWQTRSKPVTDEQWLRNLAGYYGSLGWSSGPHFFITPKNFCVLSPPTKRGIHAASFNAVSWGVEVVGNFDHEDFVGFIRERTIDGLAVMHLSAGLQPGPYEKGVRGLHFHRDDPKTTKTCPGKKVNKNVLINDVETRIEMMTQGDDPDERVDEDGTKAVEPSIAPEGTVNSPDGKLNMRADASARSPVIIELTSGTKVAITGEAKNGDTQWLRVWTRVGGEPHVGWVAARYIQR